RERRRQRERRRRQDRLRARDVTRAQPGRPDLDLTGQCQGDRDRAVNRRNVPQRPQEPHGQTLARRRPPDHRPPGTSKSPARPIGTSRAADDTHAPAEDDQVVQRKGGDTMWKPLTYAVGAGAVIGALAWIDPIFIPLVLAGPIVT